MIEVTLQDGSTIITDYSVSVSGIVGVTKQITDQAGKKRKGITDALGRMIRVIEDPDGQALNTDYVFDTLGNLRKTIQGEQNRFFTYDSIGRLLYAKQPEQNTNGSFSATDSVTGNAGWSVKYEYDDNGNLIKTTDAKGVYIQGTYDNLNRLKIRDYSDSTPDVSFYYDGKGLGSVPARSNGKKTKVTNSISETRYTSFDELGRLLTHQQITDGQTYSTAYEYNLSGGLIKETYPSGREVHNEIDEDGALSRVWGQNASAINTYANAFNYNVNGSVEKMRLGNGKWETAQYNSRMQVTQIGLGTGSNSQDLLKLELGYGSNTQNNGSLRSQKVSFNGLANPFEQTYTYDDLNRLQVAEEKVSGSTTWKQTFVVDRYGNRRFDETNTTTLGSCSTAICNPTISTATNRLTSSGYDFDENGNLIEDAEGRRFRYDAESHQNEFFAPNNISQTPDATYYYNGEGLRVKKISPTETTVFVYDASSKVIAEFSTQTSQTPQLSYLTQDHLGSPRIITNENGEVISRKDFTAFGEENITAQRTLALGYEPPEIREGYTGYENDTESGLDFAQARYYSSTHGRFTTIDPLTSSQNIRNPQTFNRYSYVLNSPYKFTDPLGLLPVSWNSGGGCSAEFSSCDENDFGIGVDDYANQMYQTEIARLEAQQAFAHGNTDLGWQIIRNSEGLQAVDQNGNAIQDPNQPTATAETTASGDPPIIVLGKATLVNGTGDGQRSIVSKSDTYDYKNPLEEGFSTAYDAAIDATEVDAKYSDSMHLRVDLSIIGTGSFLSESDKLGVNSVKVRSNFARNMSVVASTKDSPNPIVSAAASSVTVYIKMSINDFKQPGSIIVNLKATANYKEGYISDKGNLQLGTERNRTKTQEFRIKIVH